jgi:hypothetical protein
MLPSPFHRRRHDHRAIDCGGGAVANGRFADRTPPPKHPRSSEERAGGIDRCKRLRTSIFDAEPDTVPAVFKNRRKSRIGDNHRTCNRRLRGPTLLPPGGIAPRLLTISRF